MKESYTNEESFTCIFYTLKTANPRQNTTGMQRKKRDMNKPEFKGNHTTCK